MFLYLEMEDHEHEMERYKVKFRELELAVANAVTDKKGNFSQIAFVGMSWKQIEIIGDYSYTSINTVLTG